MPLDQSAHSRILRVWYKHAGDFPQRVSPQEAEAIQRGLLSLATHSNRWLRPPESWQDRKRNLGKLFQSLLHHLLVRYRPPHVLESVWLSRDRDEELAMFQRWYLHLAAGGSLRDCDLPIPFTKRMCHFFCRTPKHLNLKQAIRWSQIRGLGGPEGLAEDIARSRLGSDFDEQKFWIKVIHWLINNSASMHQVGPVINFIYAQRFGGAEPPAQPNFQIKHHTTRSLIRRMNEWLCQLRFGAGRPAEASRKWAASGMCQLDCLHPDRLNRVIVYELLSEDELIQEGCDMDHCVGGYTNQCLTGECSIWSMKFVNRNTNRVLHGLTIEVQDRIVVQARGRRNRLPTTEEADWLKLWAMQARIHVPSSLPMP